MSFQALAWAGQQRTHLPAEKLVLFQLAWHLNESSGVCNPSLDTLAEETGLGRSTVKRALDGLQKQGLIMKFSASEKGCRVSNSYSLNRSNMDPLIGSSEGPNRVTMNQRIGPPWTSNRVLGTGNEHGSIKTEYCVREPVAPPEHNPQAKQEALRKLQELKLKGPLLRAIQGFK